MTNRIVETKTVDDENFEFLLAQSDYKLNAVFRSKNPQVNIYPNTPMVSSHNDVVPTTYSITSPKDTTKSATFSFDINHTTNALIDLKDFYFDVNAFAYANIKNQSTSDVPTITPKFANQPLLSLFDHVDLYIDDVLIERSNFASLSANARYALEYPHNPISEKSFEVNGWSQSDFYNEVNRADGTLTIKYNNNIIVTYNMNPTVDDTVYHGLCYVNITEKIKLSDLFSCINTLPPLFNHSVRVMLVRANSSYIGADLRLCGRKENPDKTKPQSFKLELDGFEQFKLCGCTYIITDQLKNACEKYYSKKIETLFTSRTELINSFPSTPTGGSEMSFVVNTNLAYKNKCLVICIPRTNNPTGLIQPVTPTDKIKDAASTAANINFSEYCKCYNDYTFGGLAQMDITTANGLKLAHFQMDRDGTTTKMNINDFDIMGGFDMALYPTECRIYNYLEVYEQYKKCREHFNQLPEEAIDYISFLKSYCIYCVDLSPFDITANEQIRITMKFGVWAQNYNPFYLYNYSGEAAVDYLVAANGKSYTSSSILINLYADKILRLLPNAKCEIAQLFSEPDSNSIGNVGQNVNETQ